MQMKDFGCTESFFTKRVPILLRKVPKLISGLDGVYSLKRFSIFRIESDFCTPLNNQHAVFLCFRSKKWIVFKHLINKIFPVF